MGKYEFLRNPTGNHGSVIGAMMANPAPQPPSHWAFYFRVADIDEALARVKDAGGQIINGPHEVPGGDWSVNGVDPQGAHFALVGQKS
jgi:uncharacterized protein